MPDPLPLHINLADIPWESNPSEGRYGSDDRIVAEHVTQKRLDMAVTRLAPGKSSCPYPKRRKAPTFRRGDVRRAA